MAFGICRNTWIRVLICYLIFLFSMSDTCHTIQKHTTWAELVTLDWVVRSILLWCCCCLFGLLIPHLKLNTTPVWIATGIWSVRPTWKYQLSNQLTEQHLPITIELHYLKSSTVTLSKGQLKGVSCFYFTINIKSNQCLELILNV